MKAKDMLGLKEVSKEEIAVVLDLAAQMKKVVCSNSKKADYFLGKSMATMFYENSTRTKSSFEMACNYMGGTFSSLNVATSSVNKGESLADTARTLDAFGTDVIVIRHSVSGTPHLIAPLVKASVINAGDGTNEHPTQALLDMFTIREKYGKLSGLTVALIGDIKFSRVARSNIWGLSKCGVKIKICGPGTLLPAGIGEIDGVTVCKTLKEAVLNADAVMALRLQKERMANGLLPGVEEFSAFYGVDGEILSYAKKDALLMHPGPVNRNVELKESALGSKQNVIDAQVTNGVAVRMALMCLLTNGAGA